MHDVFLLRVSINNFNYADNHIHGTYSTMNKSKIRIISDLHLEFGAAQTQRISVMPDEKDTVLIIAGDLGVAVHESTYMPFLTDVHKRFKKVIYIAGNHEHYGGDFANTQEIIESNIENAGLNDVITFMERDTLDIDGVRFIGTTLWSDMDNENPLTVMHSNKYMNDYRQIRANNGKLSVDSTIFEFKMSKEYITKKLNESFIDNVYPIVVTHHAPSFQSVSDGFQGSPLNGAFCSDLTEMILYSPTDLTWIHGHVHQNHDYLVHDRCRVICNPHGYGSENRNWIEELVIER